MSASDKKKLRKEQKAAILTERQRKEKADAKKLTVYTACFVGVMLLVVCAFLAIAGPNVYKNLTKGLAEKNTIAAMVGDEKLNTVQFNYYFRDTVQEFYSDWYSSGSENPDIYIKDVLGLDTSLPLDEQVQDEETGKTWADYFVELALENAKSDYTLYNMAMNDETFELSQDDKDAIDNTMSSISTYAGYYQTTADNYMTAIYGLGSSAKSYKEYYERSVIADAYSAAQNDAITYTDDQLREHEKDKFDNYSSYTYAQVYLTYTQFLIDETETEETTTEETTTDETKTEENTTEEETEEEETEEVEAEEESVTEEQKEAARTAMKAAAELLATAKTVDEMKELAKTIKVAKGSSITVNESKSVLHTSLNASLSDWLCAEGRTEGDIEAIPNFIKDDDGNETDVANGYYVVLFGNKSDNKIPMGNVRHLLVKFKDGEENEETGETTYSDEQKAAAKETAEGYLKTWKDGAATEETFIELVKEHSEDTSAADGGLFEDITPASSYVENFLNWSIDPARKAGDTDVIETQYGYHVMYYVGASDLNYRDYMITNELRAVDHQAWYDKTIEAATAKIEDLSLIDLSMVLNPA